MESTSLLLFAASTPQIQYNTSTNPNNDFIIAAIWRDEEFDVHSKRWGPERGRISVTQQRGVFSQSTHLLFLRAIELEPTWRLLQIQRRRARYSSRTFQWISQQGLELRLVRVME